LDATERAEPVDHVPPPEPVPHPVWLARVKVSRTRGDEDVRVAVAGEVVAVP
jgi:hypothetical protein